MRIAMISMAYIVSGHGYLSAMTCGQLEFLTGSQNTTLAKYPECSRYFSGENPNQAGIVEGTMNGDGPEGIIAVLSIVFGAGFWLCFSLHVVAVEVYVSCCTRHQVCVCV